MSKCPHGVYRSRGDDLTACNCCLTNRPRAGSICCEQCHLATTDNPATKEESTVTTECQCSDEYGPCENHCEMLCQREGSSLRSADELARLFIDDARDLGAEISPYGESVLTVVDAGFDGAWLTDPDLADALRDLVFQVEQYLADLVVTWDDGYTIVRPSADCPLYSDDAS